MHRRQLLNLLLVSPLFALPLGAYATQIRNARLWRSNDKLRLVFDLSGPVQYKTFSLASPDRLIIDLPEKPTVSALFIGLAPAPVNSAWIATGRVTPLRVRSPRM